MPHSATSTALTPPTSPTFGAVPAMQAARIGQQAYALLATNEVPKNPAEVAAALSVTEQQLADGISAYVYVMTGWDLSQDRSLSRRAVA